MVAEATERRVSCQEADLRYNFGASAARYSWDLDARLGMRQYIDEAVVVVYHDKFNDFGKYL